MFSIWLLFFNHILINFSLKLKLTMRQCNNWNIWVNLEGNQVSFLVHIMNFRLISFIHGATTQTDFLVISWKIVNSLIRTVACFVLQVNDILTESLLKCLLVSFYFHFFRPLPFANNGSWKRVFWSVLCVLCLWISGGMCCCSTDYTGKKNIQLCRKYLFYL